MAPFSDSSSHAQDSDSTELHKREDSKRTERRFMCFFSNFLCFGGCLVNCFSSNTPCTCLDSGFSNREIVLFNIFYVYPIFFPYIFVVTWDFSPTIFFHQTDSVILRSSYSEIICIFDGFRIPCRPTPHVAGLSGRERSLLARPSSLEWRSCGQPERTGRGECGRPDQWQGG